MKGFAMGLAACGGVASITLFIVGPALGYARALPALPAFTVFGLGMLLGVPSGLVGLGMLMRSERDAAVWLALMGLPAALFLLYAVVSARGAPAINDISTDLVYPPQFVHAMTLPENAGRDMAFPDKFKEAIKKSYPEVRTLAMPGSVDEVFAKAMELAREGKGMEVTATVITPSESVFEGYAESRLFGFVDDIVVRVTKVDEGGCVVDMRSKSRLGKGDLGVNAERIRAFFAGLQSG